MKMFLASIAAVFALTACNGSGMSSAVPGGAPRETQDFLGGSPRQTQDFLGGSPAARVGAANAMQSRPSVAAANAAGQVTGTIVNHNGNPVTSATVLATDQSGNLVNVTASGSDGKFTLRALPPGAYTIAVKNSYVTASGEAVTATGNDAGAAPSQLIVISPGGVLVMDSLVD